jgi:hypothetical protein
MLMSCCGDMPVFYYQRDTKARRSEAVETDLARWSGIEIPYLLNKRGQGSSDDGEGPLVWGNSGATIVPDIWAGCRLHT